MSGRILVPSLVLFVSSLSIAAAPVIYPPRDRAVVARLADAGPHAGLCDQCHTAHGEDQTSIYPNALKGPNDNSVCVTCHATPWAGGSFATEPLYRATGHGSSMGMIWPGPAPPARVEPDSPTKCLNCHDPHGWTDAFGTVPRLANAREEKLCLACHDGSPAITNIATDLGKPYRHPIVDYSRRHQGAGESLPTDFGTTPLNARHSECEDCHNPHLGRADKTAPIGAALSLTTLGVSRVSVFNGAAGAVPGLSFVAGSDTLSGPPAEYELCFKCHSSWTTQPTGQTDLARVMNPNNPSYHPTEAAGANPGIDPVAFVPGWDANSITRCGDCHGSDFGSTRGPHGSIYPAILKRPYPASPGPRDMTSDELCFSCHSYDVYANPGSAEGLRMASGFNAPGVAAGHAEHVGQDHVPCYACHTTHGSTSLPFLMVTGRSPGLIAYQKTPSGGSCTPTCHVPKTYRRVTP